MKKAKNKETNMAMKKERQFLFNGIMSKCKTMIWQAPLLDKNDCTNVYAIEADVAFKSIKIKFVTI